MDINPETESKKPRPEKKPPLKTLKVFQNPNSNPENWIQIIGSQFAISDFQIYLIWVIDLMLVKIHFYCEFFLIRTLSTNCTAADMEHASAHRNKPVAIRFRYLKNRVSTCQHFKKAVIPIWNHPGFLCFYYFPSPPWASVVNKRVQRQQLGQLLRWVDEVL